MVKKQTWRSWLVGYYGYFAIGEVEGYILLESHTFLVNKTNKVPTRLPCGKPWLVHMNAYPTTCQSNIGPTHLLDHLVTSMWLVAGIPCHLSVDCTCHMAPCGCSMWPHFLPLLPVLSKIQNSITFTSVGCFS